jgi:glycosyltransferase involved in cell wall biosynthesis
VASSNRKTSSQPLVSVLTPVYNGERYLAECIESVLGQSYENWEYIIVNNCSTDRTLDIATKYAREDPRVRIVNNTEFVSALRNHNIALTLMSPLSRYCKFIQADDLLFPTCLSQMVELAEMHPSVGIVTSYQLIDSWVRCDGLPYPSTVVPGTEVCRKYLLGEDRLLFGNMSSFLVRADIVREQTPFLNEKQLCADTEVYFSILGRHDFGFVHQVLTFRRITEEALSSFCERHNYWTIAVLYLAMTYGSKYLTPEEHEKCLRDTIAEYYRCQGHELFRLREKSFWQYHRKMMKELGMSFSNARVLKGAMAEAARVLFEPVKAVGRQVRYVRNGQARVRPKVVPKG